MQARHAACGQSLAVLLIAGVLVAACGRAAPVRSRPTGRATPSAEAPAPPPSTWAALGRFTPLSIQPNQGRIAAAPGVLAVCVPDGVRVSRDGGASWTMVATSGVPAALAATAYAVAPPPGRRVPPCRTAMADPQRGGSVYAVYAVGLAKYGMPPVFYAAVYTADGGKSWKAVSPPAGFDAGGFGGLTLTKAGAVQALYGRPLGSGQGERPPFALVATRDGGASWQPALLGCPRGGGPCLRWGPTPSGTGSCAMHAYPQPIEMSTDGGKTWGPAYNPVQTDLANGCYLNELVGLSATRALLVGRDGMTGDASVRVSDDGGRTWRAVLLPPLPRGTSPAPGGVQMLPDGALIAVVSGQASPLPVELLATGAAAWCTVPGLAIGGTYTDPGTVQPAGDRLVWLQQATAAGAPSLRSVALSSVRC